jgi:hypothetical protein
MRTFNVGKTKQAKENATNEKKSAASCNTSNPSPEMQP